MRVISFLRRIVKQYQNDCCFSLRLANTRLCNTVKRKLNMSIDNEVIDEIVLRYLEIDCGIRKFAENYEVIAVSKPNPQSLPVWVCWWQDLNNSPDIVKQCIKSIQKNSGAHPVHIITHNNYHQWIEIPSNMIDLVNTNKMSLAHLSDYLRFALLYKYGGIWIDSTIYISQKIPDEVFKYELYTGREYKSSYFSKGRWTTFLFSGWPNETLFSFLAESIELYWKKNDRAIDYLFLDYLIDIAYRYIPECKNKIDKVPINNLQRDELAKAMWKQIPSKEFDSIISDSTFFYKLSWREKYSETSSSGEETVYKYFCNMKI